MKLSLKACHKRSKSGMDKLAVVSSGCLRRKAIAAAAPCVLARFRARKSFPRYEQDMDGVCMAVLEEEDGGLVAKDGMMVCA